MKYILIFIFLIIAQMSIGQAPQKMSYQAVIRDATNNLIIFKSVGIRISILKGGVNGLPVYIETHNVMTNSNGLISLQLGGGIVVNGKFSNIDWSNGPYFVYTETDPEGGFNYSINGGSELLSVPYALFAANSNAGFDSSYLNNKILVLQKQSIENKNNIQNNLDSIITNAQQIKLNVDNIQTNTDNIKNNLDTLNSKISTVDFNSLIAGYQKLGQFVTALSLEGVDSFDIKINGNLTASKTVTVGGNIEALGSTSTLGTLEKPFKGLFISSGSLSIASDTLGQNIPAAVLSNVRGSLEISAGGLKLVGINQAFVAPRIISTLTGNASTASKLETPRTINGILFDGSSNIILPELDHDDQYTKIAQLNGTDSFNINIKGNLGAIGNVTVAGNIEAFGTTSTLGTLEKPFKGLFISAGSLSIASDLVGQNIPPAVLSNINGNLQISSGGIKLLGDADFIASHFIGSLTGNAATVTTNANLTGVVTSVGNVTSIASGTITNSMIANTAVANLFGTNTGDQTLPTLESLGASPKVGSNEFTTTGLLTKLTLSSNKSEEQAEVIDLSISIHKLSGIRGRHYILKDGMEGQIIYITPFGDRTTYSDITIDIENGTIWVSNQLLTSNRDRPVVWLPFNEKIPSKTLATALFSENRWFITGGTSTY